MLYSYKGNYPEELPDRWRFEDGTVRTDLKSITISELNTLGWYGPITMPGDIIGTNTNTHGYVWNSDTLEFDAFELSYDEKRKNVNYQVFWDSFLDTSAYQTIKNAASSSLAINTMVTEFIALISDAKLKRDNVQKIQESINNIITSISFSPNELSEIHKCLSFSGMYAIYSINIE